MKNLLLLLFVVMTIASCSPYKNYVTASYYRLAPSHQKIAVLPAESITTGRIPEDLTDDQIYAIEENESVLFQAALYNQLVRESGARKRDIQIDLQSYRDTNTKLEEAGVSIKESWTIKSTELAQILGVDAIVRTRIEKEYLLSTEESVGLEVANILLTRIPNNPIGYIDNSTSQVFVSSSIIATSDNTTIWNHNGSFATRWDVKHSDVVNAATNISARRFPYRGK